MIYILMINNTHEMV